MRRVKQWVLSEDQQFFQTAVQSLFCLSVELVQGLTAAPWPIYWWWSDVCEEQDMDWQQKKGVMEKVCR